MADDVKEETLKEIEEVKKLCDEWGSFGETFFNLFLGKLSKITQENYETTKTTKNN